MRVIKKFSALFAALMTAQFAWAAQEPFLPAGSVSARAAALGGSELVLPGAAESVFSNPAALSQLGGPEIIAGFGAAGQGGELQGFAAAAMPLVGGLTCGLSGAGMRFSPDLQWADTNAFLASLAFPLSPNGKLLAGISGKYLSQTVPGQTGAASGGGVDLGARYRALSIPGGAVLDLSLALLDAQTVLKNADWEILLPSIFGVGGAVRFSGDTLLALAYHHHFSSTPLFANYEELRFGLEQGWLIDGWGRLAGRAGYSQRLGETGWITAGLGAEYGDWRLDYGLQFSPASQAGFHQVALAWSPQRMIARNKTEAETPAAPTPAPTQESSVRLFSVLESAAVMVKKNAAREAAPVSTPTPAPTPAPTAERRAPAPEAANNNYAYHLSMPSGPADQERVTLAPELEMPGTFSSYINSLRNKNQNIRIENQALRLHIVVNPFSPNNDGRKDKTIFLGRVESDNLKMSRWVLHVLQGDQVVRTFKGGRRLPYNLEWDGGDERGQKLSDGSYDVLLRVFDENGIEQAAVTESVILQTQAAPVTITAPDGVALVGDASDKPLLFTLPKSPHSEQWEFTIHGPGGRRVYQRRGNGEVPEKITWTPRVNGRVAEDGRYRASIGFFNDAGLKVTGEKEFSIGYAAFGVALSADPLLFKPAGEDGGQGVTFKFSVQGDVKAVRWVLTIREDKQEQPVRVLAGNGAPPEAMIWDGKDGGGQNVAGGKVFRAALKLISAVGTEQSAEAPPVQCDLGAYTGTQALTINLVRVSYPSGAAELSEEARKALRGAAEVVLRYKTDYQLRILGHCDLNEAKGRETELSRARAQGVTDFLATEGKIPSEKMETVGYGTDKPLTSGAAEEDQAKNRRAEVVLFAK